MAQKPGGESGERATSTGLPLEKSVEREGRTLQAGRELDRLIARRFDLPEYTTGQEFGTGGGLPVRYSRDPGAAMKLLELADVWNISFDRAYQEACTVKLRVRDRLGEARASQVPLAICRAMLAAAGPED